MLRGSLLRGIGVVAGAAGAVGAGAVGYLLRRPLAQVHGEVRIRGLEGHVEIVRDRWGIPHVSATSEVDAHFGLAFCHAQDRLWQMELNRRLARGELAEVFGEDALPLDQFIRRLGPHRSARREWECLSASTRQSLEAYAAGLNAAIDLMVAQGKQPVEMRLARMTPRPWEPLDSLAFGRYMGFTLSPNWTSELIRSRLISRLGYAAAAALEPDVWQPEAGSDAVPLLRDWGPATPLRPTNPGPIRVASRQGGSNAWAVDGRRSTTGKPLLATDPHLQPTLPGIWYEAHLIGGADLNVIGATLPGVPGVMLGHNRQIAWGLTVSYADVQDLYVERVDPGDARRVEYLDGWESGTLVRESINVRGRMRPWVEEVLLTPRHGPLLTPTPALADEHRFLALRSTPLEAPEAASALLHLNKARNWEEFREAMSLWSAGSFDCVYADVEGNIGHQMVGLVPVRSRGEGLVPSPGWSGRYEWTGNVPFEQLPHGLNPKEGVWSTANQDLNERAGFFLGREFDAPTRYQRIRQVLESRERHSAVDFGVLQSDQVSLPGREVAAIVGRLVVARSSIEQRALDEISRWDGRVGADSVGAAIYQALHIEWLKLRLGGDQQDLLTMLLGQGPHPVLGNVTSFYSLQKVRWVEELRSSESNLADGRARAGEHLRGADLQVAFGNTVSALRRRIGADVSEWQWGRLHTLQLQHPMSVRKPLGVLFNPPEVCIGGDLDTVNSGGPMPGGFEAGMRISSYRMIADVGDWDASLSVMPPGQSGHRGSSHYADQIEPWLIGAYHPQAFSRPAVKRVARHTLHLLPGGTPSR